MKRAALVLCMILLSSPVAAQEDDGGFDLMEEGAKLILRGLMSEMEPALEELEDAFREMQPLMQDFLVEMGPALRGILQQVDDWTDYHPPEMLENGDIIIRRRTPVLPDDRPDQQPMSPNSEIEL